MYFCFTENSGSVCEERKPEDFQRITEASYQIKEEVSVRTGKLCNACFLFVHYYIIQHVFAEPSAQFHEKEEKLELKNETVVTDEDKSSKIESYLNI